MDMNAEHKYDKNMRYFEWFSNTVFCSSRSGNAAPLLLLVNQNKNTLQIFLTEFFVKTT